MSDDVWRRRRDEDDDEEFGGPLFSDPDATGVVPEVDELGSDDERLSFGSGESGALPHWTEPPTGEVPRLGRDDAPPVKDPTGEHPLDVDVWSTFSDAEGPTWADDDEELADLATPAPPRDGTGEHFFDLADEPPPPRREPARISIGTDPTGDTARPRTARPEGGRRQGARPSERPGPRGPARPSRPTPSGPPAKGRNMPAAVAAGLIIAAAFIGALLWRPAAVVAFVVVVVGLAAVEFYAKVTEKGYRPATFAGILACVSLPLVAYWVGDGGLVLVIAFAFLAAATGFVGADSVSSGPLPNMAITMLGVIWIGLMGAYGALIVSLSAVGGGLTNVGTDTLFIVAIGVVANDVGAYFVGSGIGRSPLREWISPNKSVEGLIGGTVFTFLAVILVGLQSDTWNGLDRALLIALVISVLAPLGDLTESMFKRNLDVKDFGTLVPGHGGVLDRFDGFLFVLPGIYYLTLVIAPWQS